MNNMMSILEIRYGHVVERLLACWGDPVGFADLFNDLAFDSRGTRQGWPDDAWQELQFLQLLHKTAFAPTKEQEESGNEETKWV